MNAEEIKHGKVKVDSAKLKNAKEVQIEVEGAEVGDIILVESSSKRVEPIGSWVNQKDEATVVFQCVEEEEAEEAEQEFSYTLAKA